MLRFPSLSLLAISLCILPRAVDAAGESWRYYRAGNTGIQGDECEALWVGPDGDPYIAGYDAAFAEGGFAKFVQAENRWINFSNVDYPVLGHPASDIDMRITDIVPETSGRLWMGTWSGALRFDPAVGASSLQRFGPGNSELSSGIILDMESAPDGTIWFANDGCVRYDPATNTWTRWAEGNRSLAAQPRPGGGYWIWSTSLPPIEEVPSRFDSVTQQWNLLPSTGQPGEIVGMPGHDCVDDAGNFWAIRRTTPGDWNSLDYRSPDGVWTTPTEPYASFAFYVWAFRAYGDGRAVAVDEGGTVYRFDGTSWQNLGEWRPGPYTFSVDVDAAENIWVCGSEGAARYDVATSQWQRYRVTNTGCGDNFTGDLTIDEVNGHVYATSNIASGIGGMTRFDGERWTSWNQLHYGLGFDWPFDTDNSLAVAARASTGSVAVTPSDNSYGIHDWNGTGFQQDGNLEGARQLVEDSMGRLWAIGGSTTLSRFDGSSWSVAPGIASFSGRSLRKDPERPGTVWASSDWELARTDGTYSFARTIDDFPGSATWFTGLAPGPGGEVWIGTWTQFTATGGTLIHLDADTGTYETWEHDLGWPFPGDHVRPLAVTPDGRVWMSYDSTAPSTAAGLCWFDGTNVGAFPAPVGGVPQWGGLPHAAIADLEFREVAGGYELWMACLSRGIAVLNVPFSGSVGAPLPEAPSRIELAAAPNPFRDTTTFGFALDREAPLRLTVHDVQGRLVRVLANRLEAPGRHEVRWDGRDEQRRAVASGVYFVRLESDGDRSEKKILLVR
ncbi:MAG: FlgD immunoglobulin-like domain containing protein [bacterium]